MEEREYCAQIGCNRNLSIKPLLILAATEGYFFPWDHVHKFSWGIKMGNPKKSGIWKKIGYGMHLNKMEKCNCQFNLYRCDDVLYN